MWHENQLKVAANGMRTSGRGARVKTAAVVSIWQSMAREPAAEERTQRLRWCPLQALVTEEHV